MAVIGTGGMTADGLQDFPIALVSRGPLLRRDLRRLRSVCGLQAVLQATSQKFEEVAAGGRKRLRPAGA
jgi:hypothetical protein